MLTKGIDVSHWDGEIDWEKVKAAGYSFAIIKAGGSDAGIYTDSKWATNYAGATAAGLDVGAYYFPGASFTTAAAGRADAARFIDQLEGKKFAFPVFVDIEAQKAANRDGNTAATVAFLTALEDAGYYCGIYASAVAGFQELLDDTKLKSWAHWVAQYLTACTYSGTVGVWQYSATGRVSGISGYCDLNIAYIDYASTIQAAGLNGFQKTDSDVDEDKEGETVSVSRDAVVAQARSWIGLKESDGTYKVILNTYNGHKPLARGYAVQVGDAWCATFVSAVAIACDATDIIPTECSCPKMVERFKNLSEWEEADSYTPAAGDVIFYDWQDSGAGDSTGTPDHVGIVETVVGTTITAIEGNKSNAVGRRTLRVNGQYIRGYGVPRYETAADDTEEADLAVDGVWGPKTTKKLQEAVGTTVDGVISGQNEANRATCTAASDASWEWLPTTQATGSRCVAAFQTVVGADADGFWGKKTAKVAKEWLRDNAGGPKTASGVFGPASCKWLQRALNKGVI